MSDIFLSVDPALDAPPFAQIVDQLRGFIERGDLRFGDALPTVRQLAGDLGVAPNTVARAYSELQDDGLLAGDGRRGTRVARVSIADRRVRARKLRDSIADFMRSLAYRGYSEDEITTALQEFVKA